VTRVLSVIALLLLSAAPTFGTETEDAFGRFGTVRLYHGPPVTGSVVLFVSGDGGWNQGVVDMARQLAELDALVVGVDIRTYLRALAASKEPCLYPAANFEALSKYVQKKLSFPSYVTPLLVGYSSGATLVYATLVQAPPNTFLGAISMGFCPDLLLTRPMCRGSGLEWTDGPKGRGYSFLPAKTLEVPWVAFQGTIDQVCDPKASADFVARVPGAQLVSLPKVGHGFSVPRNWLPQFRDTFTRLARATKPEAPLRVASIGDLPLIEVPASGPSSDTLAVIITGDGGWGVTDRGIAESLAARGVPAVGWNSLKYYWTPKAPETSKEDLERILRHYFDAWGKRRVVLVGYSFGADVLPFMLTRLPADLQSRVRVLALIGLGSAADFEFHLVDWLGHGAHKGSLPVRPEIEKLKGMNICCFYGRSDEDALCKDLPPGLVRAIELEGGHRVGRGFGQIVEEILEEIR
jgi:type IV secretory pathway VirJ component